MADAALVLVIVVFALLLLALFYMLSPRGKRCMEATCGRGTAGEKLCAAVFGERRRPFRGGQDDEEEHRLSANASPGAASDAESEDGPPGVPPGGGTAAVHVPAFDPTGEGRLPVATAESRRNAEAAAQAADANSRRVEELLRVQALGTSRAVDAGTIVGAGTAPDGHNPPPVRGMDDVDSPPRKSTHTGHTATTSRYGGGDEGGSYAPPRVRVLPVGRAPLPGGARDGSDSDDSDGGTFGSGGRRSARPQ